MAMIDFSALAAVANYFDSDTMDVGRKGSIVDGDGFEVEVGYKPPMYTAIPCHIDFETQDNPNVATDQTNPVIQYFKVYCAVDVDVENGDYLTLYKRAADGTLLATYTGRAGAPSAYQSRLEIEVGVENFS